MEFQMYTNFFLLLWEYKNYNVEKKRTNKKEKLRKYETPYVVVALTSKAWTFNCPEHDNMAAFTRDMSMK